jgi:hypothetical protein
VKSRNVPEAYLHELYYDSIEFTIVFSNELTKNAIINIIH